MRTSNQEFSPGEFPPKKRNKATSLHRHDNKPDTHLLHGKTPPPHAPHNKPFEMHSLLPPPHRLRPSNHPYTGTHPMHRNHEALYSNPDTATTEAEGSRTRSSHRPSRSGTPSQRLPTESTNASGPLSQHHRDHRLARTPNLEAERLHILSTESKPQTRAKKRTILVYPTNTTRLDLHVSVRVFTTEPRNAENATSIVENRVTTTAPDELQYTHRRNQPTELRYLSTARTASMNPP